MRLIIAAPANGTTLKNALKAHLQNDPRVDSLTDLSSPTDAMRFIYGEKADGLLVEKT